MILTLVRSYSWVFSVPSAARTLIVSFLPSSSTRYPPTRPALVSIRIARTAEGMHNSMTINPRTKQCRRMITYASFEVVSEHADSEDFLLAGAKLLEHASNLPVLLCQVGLQLRQRAFGLSRRLFLEVNGQHLEPVALQEHHVFQVIFGNK